MTLNDVDIVETPSEISILTKTVVLDIVAAGLKLNTSPEKEI